MGWTRILWVALLGLVLAGCPSQTSGDDDDDTLPGDDDTGSDDDVTDDDVGDDDVGDDDTGDDDTGDDDTEPQPPVAVCAVSPTEVETTASATWLGSKSHDPGGLAIVDYRWSLVAHPALSGAALPACAGQPDCGPFDPDFPGLYTAQLEIENAAELTDSCTVDLLVLHPADLYLELAWTAAGDDLDLHLVAPGGTPYSDTDCYYANCTSGLLDWGKIGVTDDDPQLPLDDMMGTGPEVILIPAPAAGTYTVFVHDFDTPGLEAANPSTLRVFVGGYLAGELTVDVVGEDVDVDFCEIEVPGGKVTPL